MKKIDQEVIAVLTRSHIQGNIVVLPPGQLDRNLYQRVDKVLKAAGGKWDRRSNGHIFADGDAVGAMDPILIAGEYRDSKQDFGQFDTPPAVIDRVMEIADIKPGEWVLEPSAGLGNLAVAAIERGALVETCEIDPKRAAALVMRITKLTSPAAAESTGRHADFLTVEPGDQPAFDLVLMNPPFARQADIDHVLHAAKFLKPQGRLVAIMSPSWQFRENAKSIGFREFLAEREAEVEALPDNSFKASGTGVNAVVVSFSL